MIRSFFGLSSRSNEDAGLRNEGGLESRQASDIPTRTNRLLWQPAAFREAAPQKPHYESLFLKLHAPGGESLWLQFGARTPLPGVFRPHCHVMAVCFDPKTPGAHVAVKELYAPEQVQSAPERLDVTMGACRLTHGHTAGRLVQGGHTVAWELDFAQSGDSIQHLVWPFLYKSPLPRAKASTPLVDTRFFGWFEVDGERTAVESAPGMQGHNWGSAHGHRWAWLHTNVLLDGDTHVHGAYLEALSAKILLAGRPTPWISTVHLSCEGERLRFDTLARPWSIKSRPGVHDWQLVAEAAGRRLVVRAAAPEERFVGVEYLDPGGRLVYCRNSSIADVRLDLFSRERGGWFLQRTLKAQQSAALELAEPALPPGTAVHVPFDREG